MNRQQDQIDEQLRLLDAQLSTPRRVIFGEDIRRIAGFRRRQRMLGLSSAAVLLLLCVLFTSRYVAEVVPKVPNASPSQIAAIGDLQAELASKAELEQMQERMRELESEIQGLRHELQIAQQKSYESEVALYALALAHDEANRNVQLADLTRKFPDSLVAGKFGDPE